MDVFVYDAIFGYVNYVAVVWCVFILWKDLANHDDARYGAVMRLMRFRYLLYWHPRLDTACNYLARRIRILNMTKYRR